MRLKTNTSQATLNESLNQPTNMEMFKEPADSYMGMEEEPAMITPANQEIR